MILRYFVAFSFDTTLGVALTLAFHKLALQIAIKRKNDSSLWQRIAGCGDYGKLSCHFSDHCMVLIFTVRENVLTELYVYTSMLTFECTACTWCHVLH